MPGKRHVCAPCRGLRPAAQSPRRVNRLGQCDLSSGRFLGLELVDYNDPMNDRFQLGLRASTLSLALNTGLAVVKLVFGLAGNSFALLADAIESLGDIFSSAIVRAGLVIATRPADHDHPYGHGKAEPLAALVVSGMLLAAAISIAVQAIQEIRTPHLAPAWYTLVVLLGVVAIKEAMCRYEIRIGREIGSTAVAVDAWHHRGDALTSLAAAVGITISLIGGPGYEPADDWAALFACLIIAFNGIRFARLAVLELMDTSPHPSIADEIRTVALGVEGARHVETLIVRKIGPSYYVDMHLEVDPDLDVRTGHAIAHAVKDRIVKQTPNVLDVLIHIEPHGE